MCVFIAISSSDPQLYSVLSNYPPELTKKVEAVFLYADQRKALSGQFMGSKNSYHGKDFCSVPNCNITSELRTVSRISMSLII